MALRRNIALCCAWRSNLCQGRACAQECRWQNDIEDCRTDRQMEGMERGALMCVCVCADLPFPPLLCIAGATPGHRMQKGRQGVVERRLNDLRGLLVDLIGTRAAAGRRIGLPLLGQSLRGVGRGVDPARDAHARPWVGESARAAAEWTGRQLRGPASPQRHARREVEGSGGASLCFTRGAPTTARREWETRLAATEQRGVLRTQGPSSNTGATSAGAARPAGCSECAGVNNPKR